MAKRMRRRDRRLPRRLRIAARREGRLRVRSGTNSLAPGAL